MNCTNCGKELTEEAKFCLECGTKVDNETAQQENKTLTCADCGSELKEGAMFCTKCGKSVSKNESEPGMWDIILVSYDDSKKIALIKEIRAITGCGLIEGKNLVEGAPNLLMQVDSEENADKIKHIIATAGGIVEIHNSTSSVPPTRDIPF